MTSTDHQLEEIGPDSGSTRRIVRRFPDRVTSGQKSDSELGHLKEAKLNI
jgi:hypothetical protein